MDTLNAPPAVAQTHPSPAPTPAAAAPPLRASDGLAHDAPDRARRGRVLRNPFVRLLLFVLLVGFGFVGASFALAGLGLGWGMLETFVVQFLVVTLAYLVLAVFVERRRPLELQPRRAAGLAHGLALGAALFLASFGLIALLGGYRFDGVDPTYDPWLMVFVVGLVAGTTEEMMFRGVLFRLTEELVGTWGAAAVSGAVFGLVHLTNPDATPWGAIAIGLEAGLMFALLYVVTRSLWVCMGAHAAWNVVQGPILGVAVSGTGDPGGFILTSPAGPDWLSGGRFGAEASYVTVALLVAFTVWLAVVAVRRGLVVAPWWTRRRRFPAA